VQSRALTIRLIRLAMAVALILPLMLFLFASRSSYQSISALADERLERSLDIHLVPAPLRALIDFIKSY
jgi:hypothetical protein